MAARSASHALNKRFIAGVCAAIALTVQSVMIDRSLSADDAGGAAGSPALGTSTVLDLNDLKKNPANHAWFDFRPNVKKLILAGDANSEHVSILWYTVANGSVGLHYHAKTESVYVIDGTQTDGKGTYPTASLYFIRREAGMRSATAPVFHSRLCISPRFLQHGLDRRLPTGSRRHMTCLRLTFLPRCRTAARSSLRPFRPASARRSTAASYRRSSVCVRIDA